VTVCAVQCLESRLVEQQAGWNGHNAVMQAALASATAAHEEA
jgi:hypothetical protein